MKPWPSGAGNIGKESSGRGWKEPLWGRWGSWARSNASARSALLRAKCQIKNGPTFNWPQPLKQKKRNGVAGNLDGE